MTAIITSHPTCSPIMSVLLSSHQEGKITFDQQNEDEMIQGRGNSLRQIIVGKRAFCLAHQNTHNLETFSDHEFYPIPRNGCAMRKPKVIHVHRQHTKVLKLCKRKRCLNNPTTPLYILPLLLPFSSSVPIPNLI